MAKRTTTVGCGEHTRFILQCLNGGKLSDRNNFNKEKDFEFDFGEPLWPVRGEKHLSQRFQLDLIVTRFIEAQENADEIFTAIAELAARYEKELAEWERDKAEQKRLAKIKAGQLELQLK